jgi:hypothetical protein
MHIGRHIIRPLQLSAKSLLLVCFYHGIQKWWEKIHRKVPGETNRWRRSAAAADASSGVQRRQSPRQVNATVQLQSPSRTQASDFCGSLSEAEGAASR